MCLQQKDDMNLPDLIFRLFSFIGSKRRVQLCVLFFLMILSSFAEIVSLGIVFPFLAVLTDPESIYNSSYILPLIKILRIESPSELLIPLTALFCSAALFAGILRLASLYVQTRLGHAIGADLSIDIYKKTLSQPYSVHISRNSSEVIAGIATKTSNVIYYIVLPILNILSSILLIISIMGMLLFIDINVALMVFLIFGFIYLVVVFITKKRLQIYGDRVSSQQNKVIKNLQEGLGGIRYILIDSVQDIFAKQFRSSDLSVRRGLANIQIISGAPRFIIEALGMILIASIAYYLSKDQEGLSSAIPLLGAFALGAQRLLPVMQLLFSSFSALRGGTATLRDVLKLLDQKIPTKTRIIHPMTFDNTITLNNVFFHYENDSKFILKDINLQVNKGDKIGIIGKTGSGKTTLLDILMGLLEPSEGEFKIDSNLLDRHNTQKWQNIISHVPQNIFLIDGTVAENIAFGISKDEIDIQKIERSIEIACLEDMLTKFENGVDTKVGREVHRFQVDKNSELALQGHSIKEQK